MKKEIKYYVIGGQPAIYRAEDTEEVESCGRITTHDGRTIRVPKDGAVPVVWARKA